jgi:hypothetical protein
MAIDGERNAVTVTTPQQRGQDVRACRNFAVSARSLESP